MKLRDVGQDIPGTKGGVEGHDLAVDFVPYEAITFRITAVCHNKFRPGRLHKPVLNQSIYHV